ncbi:MAG: efflux RND transporter periplasmic adaptor subunit, partial [Myxococcales bacterium]
MVTLGSSRRWSVAVATALAFSVAAGCRGAPPHVHEEPAARGATGGAPATVWTCSMHPQVRQPAPGKCPLCGMDLVPLKEEDDGAAGPTRLVVSEAAAALMEVETAPVKRSAVDHVVRLSGRIDFDETRLHAVVVRAEGEVRRLFLNYRFAPVKRGEHLADLYSPTVLNAAEELVIARRSGGGLAGPARRKLELLGVSPAQIARIEQTGQVPDTFTLFSPADGVLGELEVRQGQWIERGAVLMRIADLSQVWAVLAAYESDLPWLRWGQRVELALDSMPGETLEGTVAYIDPIVDEKSRTANVRVQLANAQGRLRPGMFVRAGVHAALNAGGDAVPPGLAGKWI